LRASGPKMIKSGCAPKEFVPRPIDSIRWMTPAL
jgi:hypothetical protein